jgi:hypothetical protein
MTKTHRLLSVALLAGAVALVLPTAFAGEDGAPVAKPATAAAEVPAAAPAASTESSAPEAKADADAPKTPSPIHTMMMWVGKQVMGTDECKCPGTEEGAAAWRKWFAGDANVPLAGLRDALVATGWTADKTIGFFSEMAKSKAGGCEKCSGSCSKCEGGCAGKCDGACKGECKGEQKPGCCGKCKGLDKNKTDAATDTAPAPADPATVK